MSNATRMSVGRGLILAAAAISLIVPFVVDMILQADLHMENVLWLPHAKLHTAMSVHAAIALAVGAVAVLAARWRRPDVVDLAVAAFLATAFWIGLVLSGLWPGTSFSIANVPSDADAVVVIGEVPIHGNVVTAIIAVVIGWVGFGLAASASDRADQVSSAPALAAR